jgi:hypothetical protein
MQAAAEMAAKVALLMTVVVDQVAVVQADIREMAALAVPVTAEMVQQEPEEQPVAVEEEAALRE